MSDFIFKNLTGFGFSAADSVEIIKALKTYERIYGRSWKAELNGDWMRAYYPYVTDRQAGLLQAVRNSWEASRFLLKLTTPKIKAETLGEENA